MKYALKYASYNALLIFLIVILTLVIHASVFNNETAAQWGILAVAPLTFWGFILGFIVNIAFAKKTQLKNNKLIIYSPALLATAWSVYGFFYAVIT